MVTIVGVKLHGTLADDGDGPQFGVEDREAILVAARHQHLAAHLEGESCGDFTSFFVPRREVKHAYIVACLWGPRGAERMDELSHEERAILDEIGRYWDENGISPTFKEIIAASGIRSMGKVHLQVTRLEAMGYLRRTPNIARSLVLTGKT